MSAPNEVVLDEATAIRRELAKIRKDFADIKIKYDEIKLELDIIKSHFKNIRHVSPKLSERRSLSPMRNVYTAPTNQYSSESLSPMRSSSPTNFPRRTGSLSPSPTNFPRNNQSMNLESQESPRMFPRKSPSPFALDGNMSPNRLPFPAIADGYGYENMSPRRISFSPKEKNPAFINGSYSPSSFASSAASGALKFSGDSTDF